MSASKRARLPRLLVRFPPAAAELLSPPPPTPLPPPRLVCLVARRVVCAAVEAWRPSSAVGRRRTSRRCVVSDCVGA